MNKISDKDRPTILCVDDSSFNLDIFKEYLGTDYLVHTVETGLECLDFLKSNPHPEFILMDIVMPDMDGIEACKRIKKNKLLADIPIIIATASPSQENIDKARKAGADGFLAKPFEEEQLLKVLNKIKQKKSKSGD